MEDRKATAFDIEKAKSGYEVCTRGGEQVRIICFDAMGKYPIVALVKDKITGAELPHLYTETGKRSTEEGERESTYDLMLVSIRHQGYINIYTDCYGERYCASKIYSSEVLAWRGRIKNGEERYIATVPVEWYE